MLNRANWFYFLLFKNKVYKLLFHSLNPTFGVVHPSVTRSFKVYLILVRLLKNTSNCSPFISNLIVWIEDLLYSYKGRLTSMIEVFDFPFSFPI